MFKVSKEYTPEKSVELIGDKKGVLIPADFSQRLNLSTRGKRTWQSQYVPASARETLEKITPTDIDDIIQSKQSRLNAKDALRKLKKADSEVYGQFRDAVNTIAGTDLLESSGHTSLARWAKMAGLEE